MISMALGPKSLIIWYLDPLNLRLSPQGWRRSSSSSSCLVYFELLEDPTSLAYAPWGIPVGSYHTPFFGYLVFGVRILKP